MVPDHDETGKSFNEAAGIHRRKRADCHLKLSLRPVRASMRPPEFTGGNRSNQRVVIVLIRLASMRPPEFTGGNLPEIAAMARTDSGLQ